MDKNRLSELIKGLTREDDTPERVEMFNEILNGFDLEELQKQLEDSNSKLKDLENRYRETFKKVLDGDTGEVKEVKNDVKEDVEVEKEASFEDIFIDE